MEKTRKYRPRLEGLEHREVLTALQPAAHVLALHGLGAVTTVSAQKNTDGSVDAVSNLNGSFTKVGTVTGVLNSTFPTSGLNFTSTGVLTTPTGDVIDINFAGSNVQAKPNAVRARAQYHFNVTGGTGVYAGMTGGGTITATENLITGAVAFKFNGKLRG